mgnify:CR=1 FL=1
MKVLKHGLFLIAALLLAHAADAQKKYERETTIKSSQVHESAKAYVKSLFPSAKRIKWYREESLEGVTMEAKIKQGRTIYSIEFDTLGTLHDIELTRNFAELPSSIQKRIQDYLGNRHRRFRIKKVQVQLIGHPGILGSVIKGKNTKDTYATNYEIEYSGNEGNNPIMYESLFDHAGNHIRTKEIIERNLNHLLY